MDRVEIDIVSGEVRVYPLTTQEVADIENRPRVVYPPNWDKLLEAIFNPDKLYPIYTRLTEASFVNSNSVTLEGMALANNIAVAAGKIDQAIQVTRVEEAVASALQLLTQTSNYVFTKEEKLKWNSVVESLNFSPLMFLP